MKIHRNVTKRDIFSPSLFVYVHWHFDFTFQLNTETFLLTNVEYLSLIKSSGFVSFKWTTWTARLPSSTRLKNAKPTKYFWLEIVAVKSTEICIWLISWNMNKTVRQIILNTFGSEIENHDNLTEFSGIVKQNKYLTTFNSLVSFCYELLQTFFITFQILASVLKAIQ